MSARSRERFGIGAVVRRTGLSAPNIRVWEKRYGAVVPQRTETNRRRYSAEDVERLVLMKRLTARGHAISNIATLSRKQLEARLAKESAAEPPERIRTTAEHRLLAAGAGTASLAGENSIFDAASVVRYDDLDAALADPEPPSVDLVVIETDTLFPETIPAVRELVKRAGTVRSILIYRFTTTKTATALARAIEGLTLLRAPVSDRQLQRECLVQLSAPEPGEPALPMDESAPIPERLYARDQLGRLSRISTTVECECPQHLAGLLQGLCAFEKYSRECEDRNPQDARLHAFLHRTTAGVRRTMEEALQHVVIAEGIELD
ncbi:MAG: MerR family transcriptional regulator [Akkermansiaceae bacterium]|nr:MerR family transcriptional regulator [Akkermansiaceae bacterium]NNM29231.1 MerR family transcriptional regulator [Akkermansiaceae bacterium]